MLAYIVHWLHIRCCEWSTAVIGSYDQWRQQRLDNQEDIHPSTARRPQCQSDDIQSRRRNYNPRPVPLRVQSIAKIQGTKFYSLTLTHIVLAQLMLECFYPQAYFLLHEQLNIVNSNTILYHSQEKRLSVFAGNQPRRHKLQNFKFGVIIRHGSQLGDHSSGILRGLSSRDLATASKIMLLLSSYILTHLS